MYSKVESEPKHEVAIIEREFKFRERMAFSVLGSLGTVPLHFRDIMDISNEVLIRY